MRKLIFVTALLALIGPASALAQTTFTVNSTDDVDDGICDATHCSLREAIDTANALSGTDTIAFNIPGGDGVHTIAPSGALPTISDPVFIDASTQPEFINGPVVELDGSGAGAVDGLTITAGSSTVRGLAIFGFVNGIVLTTNGSNVLVGNVVGTASKVLECTDFDNVNAGILVTSSGNTIGGASLPEGNQIVCNGGDGIYISSANDNVIRGNFIGTGEVENLEELSDDNFGNGRDGLRIVGSNNTIGGGGILQSNTIVFNDSAGVTIAGASSSGNRLASNTIAFNGGDGMVLPDAGGGNAIEGNSIFENGGLGIDLEADGVTINDLGDNDTGPNDLQNYPEISSVRVGSAVFVEAALRSTASTNFDVEFFSSTSCDASDHGEGATFLVRDVVTTGSNGEVDFLLTAGSIDSAAFVTATATSPDGSTSEFSACEQATGYTVDIRPDSITVNQGGAARYAIDIESVGGPYTDPVALRCVSQPPFTSCTFTQDTVVPGASGVTSFLTIATNVSGISSVVPADATRDRLAHAWPGALGLGLPALGLGLFLLSDGRRRRKYGLPLLMALLLGGAALQAGCDDGTVNGPGNGIGTPPGRYLFEIQAKSDPITVIETGILRVTL